MKGLVLSGGGAKGAYQVGVFKALKEIGYEPDIITGTSIGSLNGALYVQGKYQLIKKMWNNIKTTDFINVENLDLTKMSKIELKANLWKEILKNNGIDSKRLYNKLKKYLNEKKIRKSNIKYGLVTFNLSLLRDEEITKEEIQEGKLIDYIMASCACYPTLKSYKIDDNVYIDGAYSDNMPIELAIKMGATEVVAVDLKAMGVYKRNKNNNVNIICISPKKQICEMILFKKNDIEKTIKYGYNDCMKTYKLLVGNDFTFEKNTCLKMQLLYDDDIVANIKSIFNYTGNDDSKFEKMLNKLAFNEYAKSFEQKYEKNKAECILNAMETILEATKSDDTEIYSTLRMKRIINQNFKDTKNIRADNEIDNVFKNISSDENIIKKIIEVIDRKYLILYIVRMINNIEFKENRIKLKLFSMFAKNDFFAAILVKTIKG